MTAEAERISGAMVMSHLKAIRRRLGEDGYEAVFATLSTDAQVELRLVTAFEWIRFRSLEALYDAASPRLGTTTETLHVEIASAEVGRAVTTIWKALLRLASDDALIGRAPQVFRRAYPQGRLEVVHIDKGVAELRIHDWPNMGDFAFRGLRVGIESTLRAAGRRDVSGSGKRVPDGATLRFEWKA